MPFDPSSIERFRYVDVDVDERAGEVRCRYALDDERTFEERIGVGTATGAGRALHWSTPAVDEAVRLLFLLAGVSYYKAAAPAVVDLGGTPLREGDADLLRSYYVDGLGEYAYRNGLDLTGLRIEGAAAGGPPAPFAPMPGRPIVPFGGGIDSIVVVETLRTRFPDAALFVVSRRGDRFAAIEDAAVVTGLPVLRADRVLDPQVLRSGELGFRNGHVPVTGILSAIALLVAVLEGRDAVVMSNEWSASFGNVEVDGRTVNHQYSKGEAFERGLRALLGRAFTTPPEWFSLLRPYSELWVADRFARLGRYHHVFRSCNRAFTVDPARRATTWCGRCDKCCFIDLVLAPFLPATELQAIFGGREPLQDPTLLPTFRALLATSGDVKPFECVGDVAECRTATVLASERSDRRDDAVLRALVDELGATTAAAARADAARLLRPLSATSAPDAYAPADVLV